MRRAIGFVGLLVLVGLVLAAPWQVSADVIVLKDGTRVEGTIIMTGDQTVMIQTTSGVKRIRRSEISKIEMSSPALKEYEERLAALDLASADAHFDLGAWAKEAGLEAKANERFEEAIRLDPDHDGAREALGYVLRGGRWVKPGEAKPKAEPKPEKPKAEPKPEAPEAPPPGESGDAGDSGDTGDKGDDTGKKTVTPGVGNLTPKQAKNREEAREAWERAKAGYDGVPWEKAWKLKGTGFELVCNTDRKTAEWYFKALEKINFELRKFFQNFRAGSMARMTTRVTIYRNHDEFMEKTGMPPGVGGFFQPSSGNIFGYHGEFGPSGDTIAVLAHEYTHKWERIVMDRWQNMPPWIYEGLAVYFGDGLIVPKKGRAKSHQIARDRLRTLQRAIRENRYIRVQQLIETPGGPAFTGFHYAHAWAVIYWMVNAQGDKGKAIFSSIMKHCTQKPLRPSDFEDLCVKIGGVQGFEDRWKEWVLALEVPPPGVLDEEAGVFTSTFCDASIETPGSGWEWELADDVVKPAERLAFQSALEKDGAIIKFLASNNPKHRSADAIAMDKKLQLQETHEVDEPVRAHANGYDAFSITYEEKPPPPPPKKPGEGKTPVPPEKPEGGEKKPEAEEPKPLKKMRRVYVCTAPHTISLELEAPIAEFDKHVADFERVVQSLQLHFD